MLAIYLWFFDGNNGCSLSDFVGKIGWRIENLFLWGLASKAVNDERRCR